MPWSIELQRQVQSFVADHDLGSLYREYVWGKDTWENGFSDMRQLEVDLTMAAKHGYLTRTHILSVARWGHFRGIRRIQCPECMRISLHDGHDLAEFLGIPPSAPLRLLGPAIKGMGPTYLSKVLMFSRPQLYGAIDTRLVKVFGRGYPDIEGHRWLSLEVRNYGFGPYIPETQASWPGEYDTWIAILHHIAHVLNTSGRECPHPDQYTVIGLRDKGVWIAADVETALFSYASRLLGYARKSFHGSVPTPVERLVLG